ncbi:MAG: zf-HC2 domain-containing protein, partial [Chloroflexota bacterium]|nr:zf-HC2 domain-containing protein [Chloroflexota bacterium]
MATDCSRIAELLSAAQDGAATPEERALIDRHLAGCADCRATADAYRRVDERVRLFLQGTPVPPIAAPWREVVARPGWRATVG